MADYSELPEEILLRIFIQSDKRSLLALRLVSQKCNLVVSDTPLGTAWEYAKGTTKKRMLGEPLAHSEQRGTSLGSAVFNLLYKNHRQQLEKKPKLDMENERLNSLLGLLAAEKHKRDVLNTLESVDHPAHNRTIREAIQLAEVAEFIDVNKHNPLRPENMFTRFGFPVKQVQRGAIRATQIVVTVEWNVAKTDNMHTLWCIMTFHDGEMEWPLLEFNHDGTFFFDPTGSKVIYDLLDVGMFMHELLHFFQIFGLASFIQEVNKPDLYNWLAFNEYEIIDVSLDLSTERDLAWAQTAAQQDAIAEHAHAQANAQHADADEDANAN